jgi:hypothetical protein
LTEPTFAASRRAALAYLRRHYSRFKRHHEDWTQDAAVKLIERGETNPTPERLIAFVHNVARSRVKCAEQKCVFFTEDLLQRRDNDA